MSVTTTSYRGNQYILTEAGSPYANYAQVCKDDYITLHSTFGTLPRIFKSDFNDKQDIPSVQDEANDVLYLQGGKREASLTFDVKNQDITSKKFYDDHRGEIHCVVKQSHNIPINGAKYQFEIFPNCHLQSEYAHSQPGSEYKIQYKPQKTQSLMTIDLTGACTGFDKTLTCATFVVPVGTIRAFYEE